MSHLNRLFEGFIGSIHYYLWSGWGS